ncbi:MAG: hypothetical protein JRN15_13790 [Nitrososphaerota archaeon]|nr:hypothetical protein [Nitrososphaerota archaeon]
MHNLQFGYQKSGMCGHRSLIHVLALLGITITEKEACKLTGVSRSEAPDTGTTEHKLIKAIRKAGCKPHAHTCSSSRKARSKIDKCLKRGMPVIISTDEQEHWAVLAGKHRDRYFWIDSADVRLLGHWKWDDIADWMEFDREYYLIGVEAPDMSQSVVKRYYSIYPLLKLRQYKPIIRWLFDGIRR